MGSEGLRETDFEGLRLINRGKVRDIYETGEHLLIVATDRISAFDVVMPDPIPGKGRVLSTMSAFWFRKTEDIIANHLVETGVDSYPPEFHPYRDTLRGRSMIVRKTQPLPVECVVRGYLSGSGWKDYREGRPVSGITLPPGLKESSRLGDPIFTPTTKAERGAHDLPMTKTEMEALIGKELTQRIIDISIRLYLRGYEIAERAGIIIADTKMEFGLAGSELVLIDELLTPDSSRFWPKDEYGEGRSQNSFDKQFVRDYLISIGWDQKPPAPPLPGHIIQKTAEKYEEALHRLVK
ncbi:MAG: phosphoribosylaminoimidazolesuccinocarboxamide synthase [Deltaproteobacteria bacterium]|nr:phosphoribosylaminoimidazolesuccinocarboxamide synthase [Deltaproteobacteria bacterium]